MSLSEHIKQKRKKNGLSQVELAERAGVGLRFVRDLEQGKQTLMKQAGIYVNDVFCGILTEDEEGYHFCYEKNYLASQGAAPISPTMPLTEQQYDKEMMFPVFDGLIPEGWLLDIASKSWKIDPRDRMSLLMACCKAAHENSSAAKQHLYFPIRGTTWLNWPGR